MPFALCVIIFCAATVLASVGLVYGIRDYHRTHPGHGPPEIGTFFVGTLLTFFGLFAAFMIVTVWSEYSQAGDAASAEATSAAAMYQISADLPQPYASRMRALCVEYARTITSDEWPAMARGQSSPEVSRIMEEMWLVARSPGVTKDMSVQYSLVTQMIELTKLRGERLIRAKSTLPGMLYAVLILSAILTILFGALANSSEAASRALALGSIAFLMSLSLATIWGLDHPYGGGIRLPPLSFQVLLEAGNPASHP